MPNLKRCIIHNTLVEVCFRTEEGLPFVATPYIQAIMQSILAAAQSSYPTKICHFVLMANHMHLQLIVQDPEDFVAFVGYVKRESAHAINRLLGRKKRTVWCDRYDDPKILDPEKAMQRIVYLYTNPQNANLVATIDQYPNLSSWQAFLAGGEELQVNRIARSSIAMLPAGASSIRKQEVVAQQLLQQAGEEQTLRIEPDAWMECFSQLEGTDPEEINALIIQDIRAKEKDLELERARNDTPVLGTRALQQADIRKAYIPQKRGKRMICLSSVKEYRQQFIKFYKDYTGYQSIREVMSRSRRLVHRPRMHNLVDWLSSIPPGLFCPGGRITANLVPSFIPVIGAIA